jgi:hypothetical protein
MAFLRYDNNFDITDWIHWTSPHDWMAFIPVGALSPNFNTICTASRSQRMFAPNLARGFWPPRDPKARPKQASKELFTLEFPRAGSSRSGGRHHLVMTGGIIPF